MKSKSKQAELFSKCWELRETEGPLFSMLLHVLAYIFFFCGFTRQEWNLIAPKNRRKQKVDSAEDISHFALGFAFWQPSSAAAGSCQAAVGAFVTSRGPTVGPHLMVWQPAIELLKSMDWPFRGGRCSEGVFPSDFGHVMWRLSLGSAGLGRGCVCCGTSALGSSYIYFSKLWS